MSYTVQYLQCYRPDSFPTTELLVRFAIHVALPLQSPLFNKLLASEESLKTGIQHLIARFQFDLADFKVDAHMERRRKSAYGSIVDRKLLHRGAWREKQWVGLFVLRRIILSWLTKSLIAAYARC